MLAAPGNPICEGWHTPLCPGSDGRELAGGELRIKNSHGGGVRRHQHPAGPRLKTRSGASRTAGAVVAAASSSVLLLGSTAHAANGPDTWEGNTSNLWSVGANRNPSTNAPPISGDSLVFGTAGTSGST